MRPSAVLALHRQRLLARLDRAPVRNPRVFGSVASGMDREGSDLDLLVDVMPGATLFSLGELQVDLEEMLGVHVDLLTEGDLPPSFRRDVLASARPLWMAQRLRDLLLHMQGAAAEALGFVEGMAKVDFLEDRRTQQAVLMSLVVLGEASTKIGQLYPDWVDVHPEIPLRSMRGMRNRLAHGYYQIDIDVVWDTVEQELPALLVRLATAIDALQRELG